MKPYFNSLIASAANAPHAVYVSYGMAVLFVIGGIVLYKKRGVVNGLRWPGITCAALGFASLVTNAIQSIR